MNSLTQQLDSITHGIELPSELWRQKARAHLDTLA